MKRFPKIKVPRMSDWLLYTAILLVIIWHVAPQQLPVTLYKLSLITMAAVVGYWIDRSAFPYARPDAFMQQPFSVGAPYLPEKSVSRAARSFEFTAAQLRRAIIMGCAMLAASLGI